MWVLPLFVSLLAILFLILLARIWWVPFLVVLLTVCWPFAHMLSLFTGCECHSIFILFPVWKPLFDCLCLSGCECHPLLFSFCFLTSLFLLFSKWVLPLVYPVCPLLTFLLFGFCSPACECLICPFNCMLIFNLFLRLWVPNLMHAAHCLLTFLLFISFVSMWVLLLFATCTFLVLFLNFINL